MARLTRLGPGFILVAKPSGGATVGATLAYTEAPDSFAINAKNQNALTLAYTEAPDSIAIICTGTNVATLAYTEAPDAISISIAFGSGTNNAVVAYTEAPDAFAITATMAVVNATLAYTEAPDAFSISIIAKTPTTRQRIPATAPARMVSSGTSASRQPFPPGQS